MQLRTLAALGVIRAGGPAYESHMSAGPRAIPQPYRQELLYRLLSLDVSMHHYNSGIRAVPDFPDIRYREFPTSLVEAGKSIKPTNSVHAYISVCRY